MLEAFQLDCFQSGAFQGEVYAGDVNPLWYAAPGGGDDAFHMEPKHHKGWDKKEWERKQQQEDELEQSIVKAYQQIMGIEPAAEVVAEVVAKVEAVAPVQIEYPDYSELAALMQQQRELIQQIIAEQIDEEEAILALLM